MINRTTKLRWRRRFRRSRRQVEDMGVQAEERLERHFFRRLSRIAIVRRFMAAWILLVVLLIGGVFMQTRMLGNYYLTYQPVAGGTFTEGILGSFTNANPLYAAGAVDSSVSRLIFPGLFKFDQSNKLVGDLASGWEVNEDGTHYTVHLRNHLLWQDGQPLTADDVVFTYRTLQNPDAKSPLLTSWQGITVNAVNPQTVTFDLPNALSAFPYSMTNGIVPKHVLENTPASDLRSVNFDTVSPVGAGPFKMKALEVSGTTPEDREQQIALTPFSRYYGGTPKLSTFIIRSFHDEGHMVQAFKNNELTAMAGLIKTPVELAKDVDIHEYNIPLTSEVMAFFKTSNPILGDNKVRQALVEATDTQQVLQGLGYPVVAAKEPLLQNDIGYDKTLTELPFNMDDANKLLDQAGWVKGPNGIRLKDNKPLSFKLYSQNNSEYAYVAQALQKQWHAVGADVQVALQEDSDLQTTIAFHNYDALLYGISLGVDPDVFAFWHSSQADLRSPNRLNFSEYKSPVADKALEAGRTRSDPTIRAIKYKPFLEAWRADAPALALYQPRFLYLSRTTISGLDEHIMNDSSDRYANVADWMIRQQRTDKVATDHGH